MRRTLHFRLVPGIIRDCLADSFSLPEPFIFLSVAFVFILNPYKITCFFFHETLYSNYSDKGNFIILRNKSKYFKLAVIF